MGLECSRARAWGSQYLASDDIDAGLTLTILSPMFVHSLAMDVFDTMTRLFQALGVLLFAGGLAYHFAALRIFNLVVPKDEGVEQIASDLAYGDADRQRLDVYRPFGEGPLPALVFVYGGSWDSGRRQDYGFAARALAAKGYVVFVPDYRLVPEHIYPVFVEDVAKAINFAQARATNYGGDGTHTYLVGHSAGGYNVAQAALNPLFAVKGIAAVATLAGPFDFLPFDSPKSRAAFSAFPDLPSTQPIHHVGKDAPPFLILHGADDTTVRPRNGRELSLRLKKARAVVQHTEYPDVSHVGIMLALSKAFRKNAPVLDDIDAFFKIHR
jgi:acetyl esterase/lipase